MHWPHAVHQRREALQARLQLQRQELRVVAGLVQIAVVESQLLYENPLDFWDGSRPHLSKTENYDIGAHELGARGAAHVGLDLSMFPSEVPPFKLRIGAKPKC
jgi:hypothetical protein